MAVPWAAPWYRLKHKYTLFIKHAVPAGTLRRTWQMWVCQGLTDLKQQSRILIHVCLDSRDFFFFFLQLQGIPFLLPLPRLHSLAEIFLSWLSLTHEYYPQYPSNPKLHKGKCGYTEIVLILRSMWVLEPGGWMGGLSVDRWSQSVSWNGVSQELGERDAPLTKYIF